MKAVIHILRNQATITGKLSNGANSVFVNQAVRSEPYPYLVIDDRMIESYKAKDTGSELKKMQYFIKMFADDYAQVRALADAVETELDKKAAGTYNGETITSLYLTEQESYPAKIEDRTTYIIEHEYQGIVRR